MLQDIRDNSQGVVAKVIIGLIVAVFALWGVESIIGGFIRSPAVAEVNGEEVTEAQLNAATQNLIAQLGGNVQGLDQGVLEQIALSQLIEEFLLRQKALDAGMGISEQRIDRAITQNPNFQINGVYSSDMAARTITAQGMNVPLYRQQLEEGMMLSQVGNAYASTAFVTQSELQRIAELRLQNRSFRFLSLTLGTRTLGEAIPDQDIAAYYEENQAEFSVPEQVNVQYVELSLASIMDSMELEPGLVEQQYEQERATLEGSGERRASHILFEVGPSLSGEQALEQAQAALERFRQGEAFADLALELSSDVVSAEEGGDIGYSDGSAFPQEIEDALVAMEVDEVSEPVVTEFGVHLVMLTENAVNEVAPFEEVAERIERDLKSAEAQRIYAQRLEDLSNLAFESSDLQPASEELGLSIEESGFFPRSGGEGLFGNPVVAEAAFSEQVLVNEYNSDILEVNDAQALVIRLLDRREAQVRPLEEVEGEIAVILRAELERERARTLGEELLAHLQNGDSVDELLLENELEWVEQTGVTRNSVAVNREVTNAVFAMPRPESGPAYDGITLTNGTYVVVELNEVRSGELASMAEQERQQIENSLISERGQAVYRAFLDNLQSAADVETRILQQQPPL